MVCVMQATYIYLLSILKLGDQFLFLNSVIFRKCKPNSWSVGAALVKETISQKISISIFKLGDMWKSAHLILRRPAASQKSSLSALLAREDLLL